MAEPPDQVIRSTKEWSDPMVRRINERFDQLNQTMEELFQQTYDLVRVLHEKQRSSRRTVSEDRPQQ